MSESITKVCGTCNGSGDAPGFIAGPPCKSCGGFGRVPDVEAALRWKLAELQTDLDDVRKTLGNALDDERMITMSQRKEVAILRAKLTAAEKEAKRYRQLFEGRCLQCNNLSPVHAPECIHAKRAVR